MVGFPESTRTGRSVGDRFTVSVVQLQRLPHKAEAEARYARYLAGEMRERRRNWMKITLVMLMLIVTATLFFYVMVV